MTIRSEADRSSVPQMNGVHCPVCGQDCYNTWGLIEHMKTHLKKSELVQAVDAVADVQMSDWICSQCGADCGSRIGLIMHMVNCKGNGEAPDLEMTWEDLLDEIERKPGLWFDEPEDDERIGAEICEAPYLW